MILTPLKGGFNMILDTKQGINRGLSGHLLGEVDWAVYMQSVCFKTEDCREGIMAFKERRKANFQEK